MFLSWQDDKARRQSLFSACQACVSVCACVCLCKGARMRTHRPAKKKPIQEPNEREESPGPRSVPARFGLRKLSRASVHRSLQGPHLHGN